MNEKNIKVILLTGHSGTGKSTIINYLKNTYKDIEHIPSVTTREKRDGETEGNPYYFISVDEFIKREEENDLIESEYIHGNWYGTIRSLYEEKMREGKIIVKDIGVEGVLNFQKALTNDVLTVFIKSKSVKDLKNRLKKRGDDKEEINKRLERVEYERSYVTFFDEVMINGEWENTKKRIIELMNRVK